MQDDSPTLREGGGARAFRKEIGSFPCCNDHKYLVERLTVVTMTTSADRRAAESVVPATVLSCRCHGSLDAITDSERRGLRPIGTTAHEVAVRTGALLTDLFALRGVQIFQGVRPTAEDLPRIPHVISAGCRLVLVESVAWPPGRYAATAAGQIHCGGVYTGQSVHPLLTAVRHWRQALPRGHRVSALVVVHPAAEGELDLPAPATPDLAWALAGDAVRDIRGYLPRGHPSASIKAVAALVAAITDEEGR